jgi:small subunit ribosomal protein S6
MPLYEHVFISRQDLSNTQAEALIEHFGTVLADNGGQVLGNEYWGVKTMSYRINKNRKGTTPSCDRRPCGAVTRWSA